jgi:3-oxochol-4-en-24-oyl-CoA dehydrogenase
MPSDYLPAPDAACPGEVPAEVLAECGALTADALAFAALRQRLLLRQIAGAEPSAEASVLKVVDAWNATRLRRAVLGWRGADAAAFGGPAGDAAQRYLSLPPTLLGGGTLEIQLNLIAERVLGLPR